MIINHDDNMRWNISMRRAIILHVHWRLISVTYIGVTDNGAYYDVHALSMILSRHPYRPSSAVLWTPRENQRTQVTDPCWRHARAISSQHAQGALDCFPIWLRSLSCWNPCALLENRLVRNTPSDSATQSWHWMRESSLKLASYRLIVPLLQT